MNIGVQGILQHGLNGLGHAFQGCSPTLHRMKFLKNFSPFRDVLRVIPDPFKRGGDAKHRQDSTQIGGNGLAQGDQTGRLFIHAKFKRVDGFVTAPGRIGEVQIAVQKRGGRVFDCLFDHAAHLHDETLNGLQVAIEGAGDVGVADHGSLLSRSGRKCSFRFGDLRAT